LERWEPKEDGGKEEKKKKTTRKTTEEGVEGWGGGEERVLPTQAEARASGAMDARVLSSFKERVQVGKTIYNFYLIKRAWNLMKKDKSYIKQAKINLNPTG